MPTTRHQNARLYIEVAAAVHGALVHSRTFRERPQAAAHIAREHAIGAQREARMSKRSKP